MTLHFLREVERLKRMLLDEATMVEEGLQKALKALYDNNMQLAAEVKNSDHKIDQKEIEIEEEALKILALHQPVASDLRFIISVIKINNDLERIGDLTANIAARTIDIINLPHLNVPGNIVEMADTVLLMLKESLDALINLNVKLAAKVCVDDEKVDLLHKKTFNYVKEKVQTAPQNIDFFLMLMGISRYLERIADHSTNIAEDVVYMVEGKISRHRQN